MSELHPNLEAQMLQVQKGCGPGTSSLAFCPGRRLKISSLTERV